MTGAFERPPPFDLASDLLFAAASAPLAPLERAFPGVRFRRLPGSSGGEARVPVVVWFSVVTELRFAADAQVEGVPAAGGGVPEGHPEIPYRELNVVTFAAGGRGGTEVFVPGIYATGALTVSLGGAYGMPKVRTRMGWRDDGGRVGARVLHENLESVVRARVFGFGRPLAFLLRSLWPLRVPARFPGGARVVTTVTAAPRVQVAWLHGRVSLPEPWLPDDLELWPLGLLARGMRMRLPRP